MTPRADAVAGLAEDVGKALLTFAERLRAEPQPTAARVAGSGKTRAADPESSLGAAQMAILRAVRDAGSEGLTSHEAAVATTKSNTNTPRILSSLAAKGLVVATETTPAVWTAVSQD